MLKMHWYVITLSHIMCSLCVYSTHTHPDADVLKAAFDTIRFQHILRPSDRSFDLLSSLNEQERVLATSNTSNTSLEQIRKFRPVVFLTF